MAELGRKRFGNFLSRQNTGREIGWKLQKYAGYRERLSKKTRVRFSDYSTNSKLHAVFLTVCNAFNAHIIYHT